MPMVSPERNDVREELVLQSCECWGWGRIATRALIVLGGLGWYCFGRVLLYPAV